MPARKNIAKRAKGWWYYAKVRCGTTPHTVFFGETKPVIGEECDGAPKPNRIESYVRRRPWN